MTDPYLGEIRMFAGNYAPEGWACCDGATLTIAQNTALYSIIGTIYGGDGMSTMKLPDMTDRAPMGYGNGPGLDPKAVGQYAGVTSFALDNTQLPEHTHDFMVSKNTATVAAPANGAWLGVPTKKKGPKTLSIALFKDPPSETAMNHLAVKETGGNGTGSTMTHENRQPYLGILFIISLDGDYPPRP